MVKKCNNCKRCQCKEREAFYRSFEEGTPYRDIIEDGRHIRVFSKEVEPHLLKWHQDEEDRIVYPINENDWMFQFDNGLPFPFDREIAIKKGEFHRIIKGTTDLIIEISTL